MNNDTVYRQDAIEGVETKLKKWSLLYRECCSGIGVSYSDVIKMLSDLPSAQTEIVLCKDCKHRPTRDEDGWLDFPTNRCPCQNEDDFYYSWMPKDDWFCGNAERREG